MPREAGCLVPRPDILGLGGGRTDGSSAHHSKGRLIARFDLEKPNVVSFPAPLFCGANQDAFYIFHNVSLLQASALFL